MNHLENMEALAESVRLRAYGQHDPLVEYRRESSRLYKNLFVDFKNYIRENLDKILEIQPQKNVELPKAEIDSKKKIGRNDPCWCGAKDQKTGKSIKYKKCHGK